MTISGSADLIEQLTAAAPAVPFIVWRESDDALESAGALQNTTEAALAVDVEVVRAVVPDTPTAAAASRTADPEPKRPVAKRLAVTVSKVHGVLVRAPPRYIPSLAAVCSARPLVLSPPSIGPHLPPL
eukprot:scaffold131514_cov21-Tisochrysis_lutea.AAC.2